MIFKLLAINRIIIQFLLSTDMEIFEYGIALIRNRYLGNCQFSDRQYRDKITGGRSSQSYQLIIGVDKCRHLSGFAHICLCKLYIGDKNKLFMLGPMQQTDIIAKKSILRADPREYYYLLNYIVRNQILRRYIPDFDLQNVDNVNDPRIDLCTQAVDDKVCCRYNLNHYCHISIRLQQAQMCGILPDYLQLMDKIADEIQNLYFVIESGYNFEEDPLKSRIREQDEEIARHTGVIEQKTGEITELRVKLEEYEKKIAKYEQLRSAMRDMLL